MNLLTWLSRRRFPYEPLISVEISQGRLLHNLTEFRELAPGATKNPDGSISGGRVAPVLKSNAYGHGLIEVARILEQAGGSPEGNGIPFFVVDSYFEAIALRAGGIRTPVLIIGYTRPETIACARLKSVSFTVTSMETLRHFKIERPVPPSPENGMIALSVPLGRSGRRARIHLKIDTGMRRQGILPEEIPEAIEIMRDNPSLTLEGITSHFSDADNDDGLFTEKQIAVWNRAVKQFALPFPALPYIHVSNTDGHRFTGEISATVSRLGIGLYGLSENARFDEKRSLLPVLEMKTILTGIKRLKKGESVGYSNTFHAPEDMAIATVPAGYYEGLDRRLSSAPDGSPRGFILVGPDRIPCRIVGRISMNITVIDVSKIPAAAIGDRAVVVSREPADPNSVTSMARVSGTIGYELAVHIPGQLKRIVVA
jgi:alanine racemase